MGYTTEFEGEFQLDRPLQTEHAGYLYAFANTRRMKRDDVKAEMMDDPIRLAVGLPIGQQAGYFVGGFGFSGQEEDDSVIDGNYPPSGQPGLWCGWVPSEDGRAIVWNGVEKFYNYVEWLEYLINHFLEPWGYTLNGQVTWQGEDPDDQGTIEVVSIEMSRDLDRILAVQCILLKSKPVFFGIEIGGTKLQLGVGLGDGTLAGLWRAPVDIAAGAEGIRQQINAAVPELLTKRGVKRSSIKGVGIGFGGPVDDATRTIIKSHQIQGWDHFPLADWIGELLGWPAVLGNDADVGGLAEALFGAGQGMSPIFYITIGSGIGGGLIINGEIYRGCGRGAAEIGHTTLFNGEGFLTLESVASGWGIVEQVREHWEVDHASHLSILFKLVDGDLSLLTAKHVAQAARKGDEFALRRLHDTWDYLAEAICNMIALLCPRRIVIGGGVSLMGEKLFFRPLRKLVAERIFKPFKGCYDIVPAALGEEVVVHGALALARQQRSG